MLSNNNPTQCYLLCQYGFTVWFCQLIKTVCASRVHAVACCYQRCQTAYHRISQCIAPDATIMKWSWTALENIFKSGIALQQIESCIALQYFTSIKSADATILKVWLCWNTTPFTAVLLMKVIAASFWGLENDKVSGGETFREAFPCLCVYACIRAWLRVRVLGGVLCVFCVF